MASSSLPVTTTPPALDAIPADPHQQQQQQQQQEARSLVATAPGGFSNRRSNDTSRNPGQGHKRGHSAAAFVDGVGGGPAAADGGTGHPESAADHTTHGSPPSSLTLPQVKGDDTPGRSTADTPDSTDTGNGSSNKKRKTGRGSRGVANLTPEQLERKRANDREAQRAIRERQRLRTEQYEREIAELKSKQPYQELQGVLRQKEAVEAELADVKRCMAAIMAMIQPIVGGRDDVDCCSPGQSTSFHPQPAPTAPTTHNPGSTPTSAPSPVSVGTHHGRWQSSLSPVATPVGFDGGQPSPELGLLHQQRHDLAHGLDLGTDRLGLDFLVDPSLKIARIQNGINGAQDSPQYRHVPMKHDWTAAISMIPGMQGPTPTQAHPQSQTPIYITHQQLPPVTTNAPSLPPPPYPFSPATTSTTTTNTTTSTANPALDTPLFTLLPRNCPPTCPLDSLLLDFLAERRQRAAEGLPQHEIEGPRYPSVSSLLNPTVSLYSHPLSKVFTDILARFPDLHTLPERVAVLYMMFLLMRWQVSPTEENYVRLPAWFRPVRGQIEREHPAWYDHLPFPRMREKLVREYEPGGFPFENFFIPFTTTLSVNWPYEDAYVLLASPNGEELMINPVFEQHLRMLENWTLGEAFERAFPGLAGCFNLKRGS
ncbi:hypothetical protein VTI74DRAFT_4829 [Chaetomium olivicolor]